MTQVAYNETSAETARLEASYVLPIRRETLARDIGELAHYLAWLSNRIDVTVVDGSPRNVYESHAALMPGVRHVAPDPRHACANGKVQGVVTGVDLATHDRVVIADDDVRYDDASLRRVVALLDGAEVVRPQNYFEPQAWHTRLDSARSLLNRAAGGDWPGTLGVRRSVLASTGGYDGDCLFENLELVRTVLAAGGREAVARDVFVRRRPPGTQHFLSQRVRQAYDEFARPWRLAWQLALAPVTLLLAWRKPSWLLGAVIAAAGVAEYGRRRAAGASAFGATSSLLAPAWLTERAVCSWLAVGSRLLRGGVVYRGRVMSKAATSQRELNAQHRQGTRPDATTWSSQA